MGEQNNIFTAFIDTAADISLVSEKWRKYGIVNKLDEPIKVKSFDGKSSQKLKESIVLKINFGGAKIKLKFFICKVQTPIIGIDLLRDPRLKLSINTKTNNFHVNKHTIKTRENEMLAKDEMEIRMNDSKKKEKSRANEKKVNWVRVKDTITLKPKRVTDIIVEPDTMPSDRRKQAFLSLFDEDIDSFFIPSLIIWNLKHQFVLPIENKTKDSITITRGAKLGELKSCSNSPSHTTVMAFDADDIREALNSNEATCNAVFEDDGGVDEREPQQKQTVDKGGSAAEAAGRPASDRDPDVRRSRRASRDAEATIPPDEGVDSAAPESKSNEKSEPVKFSELMEKDKIDPETLIKCYKTGITVDLNLEVPEAPINVNDEPIDVAAESKRGQDFKYWPNKHEYLQQFDLSSVEGAEREKLIDILLKFNHVFFNEDRPDQFHEGVRMKPIKLKMKDNAPPLRKEGPRRMNPEKQKLLKVHLKSMLDRKIIEEIEDGAGCYMNPCHVVIERRYIASEKAVKLKSRFCLDNRVINAALEDVQFPLPFADEFRREISAENYIVFSNCDASTFFYQFNIDEESAKRFFGFYALGRIFILRKLPMGLKSSISYVQAFMTRVFKVHPNCFPFVDDLTIRSRSISAHLAHDLPLALAICSRYNILLTPKKCDLLKSEVRVLGYQLSRSSESLTNEKKKKIKEMQFPETKKDAVSKAAFFSYFMPVAPKLSELMAPLRKLAHPKTKFAPTQTDRKQFEDLKDYLLDDDVGALRMPSNDGPVIAFCDASKHSIGTILTQLLPPLPSSKLDPSKKYLCIVACWSRKIDDDWSTFPIWLLELTAIEECTRKFDWLLSSRAFYVVSDSKTCRYWASLDLVPKDVARKILRLQRYNYRIIFLSGILNPSDWVTRVEQTDEPQSRYPRFLHQRIYNSKGIPMDWKKLFSQELADETKQFFISRRRQELAYAVSPENSLEIDEEESKNDVEAITDAIAAPPEPEVGAVSIYSSPSKRASVESAYSCIIAAYSLDDDDLEAGVEEQLEDHPIDSDAASCVKLEEFDDEKLEDVVNLQKNDKIIKEIKQIIKNDTPCPGKTEGLALSPEMNQFHKNRSLFKINDQDILLRLWHNKNGDMKQLIVVGEKQFNELLAHTHSNDASSHRHAGQKRTQNVLLKRYFNFGMRKKINKFIQMCPTCKLNKHPKTNPVNEGNQIATEPNALGLIDILGPLRGIFATTTGQPRYVYLYVDGHSRFLITKSLTSCADDQILESLILTRDTLVGLPRKMQMDGALCTSKSKSLQFLKERGVSVSHGLANVSRCQSKVERAINTFTRLLCNLRTDNPNWSFNRLVAETTFIINSSPSSALGESDSYLSPKEIHFAKAPVDFLRHASKETPKPIGSAQTTMQAARDASKITLLSDVRRYMKQKQTTSPTDYSQKLKPGMICLKRRTTFPTSSPKKLCYKLNFEVYKIDSKIATNSFKCTELRTNSQSVLAGDALVRLNGLTEDEAIQLVTEMERTAAREATFDAPSPSAVRRSTRVRTKVQ